jgi:hypothetical protein
MNEKGGMDEDEYEKYVLNVICYLYPDAANMPGKRVIIKVDGGPRRLNTELLAELRLRGFYLYCGVPNTTVVTQETDRNYGPFKSRFRRNLSDIVDARMDLEKSVSLQPWLVGMIVFGGTDPESGYVLTECAFKHGFSKEACLNAWAKVGAAPLTRACLSDPKVSRTIGDNDGGDDEYLLSILAANELATHALDDMGYNGGLLRVELKRDREDVIPLTVPHSKERVELLRYATTHSAKFLVTRGDHITTNDMFMAMEKNVSGIDATELLKVKKKRLKDMEVHAKARAVMEKWDDELQNNNLEKLSVPDLDCLLLWYGVWTKSEKLSKSEKVGRLIIARSSKGAPPMIEEWTADDEAALQSLHKKDISIDDTALGRKRILFEQQFVAASITMSDEQWHHCVQMRKQRKVDEEENEEGAV